MRVEDLERELREERPEADPEFCRELDEWAAAGFPRDRGLGPRATGERRDPMEALRRAWERLRAVPPRRLALPVGAVATVAVIGAVALSGPADDSISPTTDDTATQEAGDAGLSIEEGDQATVEPAEPASPGGEVSPDAPATTPQGAGAGDAILPPEDFFDGGGRGAARSAGERLVDATARITLGAEADEVQDVANRVVEVADRRDGIVLDSQVTTDQGGARAAFTIEIPFDQLDAALEDLSGLADVISRTEASEDITANAVRARQQLAATLDDLRRARVELIEADNRRERQVARARIDSLRAQADALEQQLQGVKREARFATVNVDITSNGEGADDGWNLDEALDDSADVLETIAGIALVTLAVLLPVALVGAIAWFIASRAQRTRRERALDD